MPPVKGPYGPGEAAKVSRAIRRGRKRKQSRPKPVQQTAPAAEAQRGRAVRGGPPVRPAPVRRPARPKPVQQTAAAAETQRGKAVRGGPPVRPAPVRPKRRVAAQAIPGLGATVKPTRGQAEREIENVRRIRQVAAAANTGGDFDKSLRSGPNSDTAAARAARKIGKPITVGKDNHYYIKQKRALLPDRHLPVDPFTGKVDRKYLVSGRSRAGAKQQASIQAPALKVLDQVTRPAHGIAAAEISDIKRGGIKEVFAVHAPGSKAAKERRRAFKRGVQLKDRSLGSDVLKAAGVKNKAVAGVGGFALDVLQDPLSYATGGTGSVAARQATKAARRVQRKAARAGLSDEAVQAGGATAARRAERAAPKGRGVTVKLGGAEVPGVRRATAAAARGTRKATRRVVGPTIATKVPAAARNIVRNVAPRVRAPGVTHEQMLAARSGARAGRARVSSAATKADILERQLVRMVPPKDYERVVDAIERGKLSRIIAPTKKARDKLQREDPKEFARRQSVAQAVHRARSEMTGAHRQAVRVGAHPKPRPNEYLTKQDLKKLDRTVASEQAHRARVVESLGKAETTAQTRAMLASQEGTLRAGTRAAVTREQEIAGARRGVVRAQQALRAELAKPVTSRRGVPALEARVQTARQTWQQARRPARERIPTPAPVGRRAGQAAERYEQRAAATQQAQQRLAASQRIPTRSQHETPEQHLRRVAAHADRHNLPLVKRRAETLLAKKPKERARGYFPRETEARLANPAERLIDKLAGTEPINEAATAGGMSRRARRTTAGHRRVEQRPLRIVNPERVARGDEAFSTDVPLVTANHLREAARASQPAEFAQNIAKAVGRPVRHADDLADGEDLYKLGHKSGTFGLHKVPSGKVPTGGRGGGQYVAMPRNFFENMERSLRGTRSMSDNELALIFDRAQGLWKQAAITSFAFHMRNLIGDIQAGYYLPGAGGSLRNIPAALKATRRSSESQRLLRPRTKAEQSRWERAVLKSNETATVKVAGKQMDLDQFLKHAADNGVLDTGIIAREVRGLGEHERLRAHAQGGRSLTKPFRGDVGRALNRWVTNRENVMRLAAFKQGLDRGMKPSDAADMANLYHIDYGELSAFEREVLRRVSPFYTWTARSLPVAGLTMIQRPGKFATLEKAREETGKAFTGEDEEDIRARMPDAVKRTLPVVIRVGGSDYAVSASLPATLLNEYPASTDIGKYLDELAHFGFGMTGPLGGVKPALELYQNQSLFTRRPIEDPDVQGGLTSAPAWIGQAPDWVKRMTGAVQGPDRDTGKTIWKWRGRADWVTRQVPGAAQQASQVAAGARPGQEPLPTPAAIASPLSGVRVDKLGRKAATQAQKNRLREERRGLERKAGVLNARGIHSDNATPEYRALRKRINEINNTLNPRKTKGRRRPAGPLPLGGGGGGEKLPLGGGSSGGKLPL